MRFLLLVLVGFVAAVHKKHVPSIEEEDQQFYDNLAKKAVSKYNSESNDLFTWHLDRTFNVQRRLSNGIHYTFDLTLVQTNCRKGRRSGKCIKSDTYKKCKAEIIRKTGQGPTGVIDYVDIRQCEESFTNDIQKFDARKIFLTNDDAISMADLRKAKIIKPKDFVPWNSFLDFIEIHEKKYRDKRQALKKFRIFKRNLKIVKQLQDTEKGTAVYGITQFSDISPAEFKKTYLPYQWDEPVYPTRYADLKTEGVNVSDIPDEVDWRKEGAVTGVKNQQACGSCWAFSVTGNIEGQWYLAKKKLVSLSEQELVDCDVIDQGCNGGLPSNAYKEIIRMGGLEPEEAYPYDAKGETCHLVKSDIAVYINDSVEIPHDEKQMQAWLAAKGPISIGLNANTLQFYRHGVAHPWRIFCEPLLLNHGVLIVGYGTDGKKPYWTIKNSWGTGWGEKGYFRLYRGKNVCGVSEMPTSSIVT